MYYRVFALSQSVLQPFRAYAETARAFYSDPANPLSETLFGRSMVAGAELFERSTRRYDKPAFDIAEVTVGGQAFAVEQTTVWQKPFCHLRHFVCKGREHPAPRLLIVAPMSGHHATLLRGTVEDMLPYADVFITDWIDARQVPLSAGRFGLDEYIDYVIDILSFLGKDTHVLAVCQPSVPVLAAVAVMEARNEPASPRSMTLIGGPIDPRVNPTAVNKLAQERGTEWFAENVVMDVPGGEPGAGRAVYPGFLQLAGFVGMNFDRHLHAHQDFFRHLVQGDEDGAEKHRRFYDEYMAVMDLSAEFYLETVDAVFVRHLLPKGEMTYRGNRVDPAAIRRCALLTIEGEKDDISGVGQTRAAHELCVNIPPHRQHYHLQAEAGHYGVFNGSRFRREIAPLISEFLQTNP
ncbi:polyhydroxyalkanoate depolymerase [Limoniibacter endophyticus]|uniref:Esterase n=1 Tax=Limoniibacter endophyticus TaxID=1565040 RepID=A0A8J3DK07_9HYPH|nr:polyhydroxyalkanoate depolymerase [Limoniibacter endophyticus]GHC80317.1 esterase [Limoniibacter endophyticus]